MSRFRKKPVEIEAMQYDGIWPNAETLLVWMGSYCSLLKGQLYINTLEGQMLVSPGDWVIKGVKGEFYPCKPDIFEMTYEPIND